MVKLLLIDDDEELCAELKELLEKEGFYLEVAHDGLKGLSLLEGRHYNILILDLKLPGINGYGVLKDIRQANKPLKVVVLSGRPMGEPIHKEVGISQEEEQRILNMADAVINKPFMIETFVGKIKELAATIVEKSQ